MNKELKITVTQDTKWIRALNEARATWGKEPKPLDYEPSDNWKRTALMAEHSPIKLVEYTIRFKDLRQWVGVHLLRHPYTLPFIHSQRVDLRPLKEEYPYLDNIMDIVAKDLGINKDDMNPRDCLPQGENNDQDFVVNAQTLINISRKRLCKCASPETQEAWRIVKDTIAEIDPIMASFMVPNCIYRGFCPEMRTCNYYKTKEFKKKLNDYRNLIGRGE